MRELIDSLNEGDDKGFAKLMEQVIAAKLYVFAQPEDEEGLTINFLNYVLEDDESILYIPIFTDEDEVNAFLEEEDVPEGYSVYEFDGDLFSELVSDEQYIMINPITGGIVFEGAHLKMSAGAGPDEGSSEDDEQE